MTKELTKEIFDKKLTHKLANSPELTEGLSGTVCFNITGDGGGHWTIDLDHVPAKISHELVEDPKVTFIVDCNDLADMVSGAITPQKAYFGGKLKIEGDLGLALRLGKIFL